MSITIRCDTAMSSGGRTVGGAARRNITNEALTTREEAAAILPDLRRRGVHRFLLVTSDYHTARAARIYRAAARDLDFRVVAAPDNNFRPDGWWRNREGQKVFFIEWCKTVANLIGM